MTLRIDVHATDGAARTGAVTTKRGTFATPCFMPVGTRGTVRSLSSVDLEDLGAEIMLGNTYHLMLRPGADTVQALGGLHGFMAWPGHVLTDSGGYQVFSLNPKVSDEGAVFRSTYDGSEHLLTPEGAVAVQEALGADIQMVLDVCPPWPATSQVLHDAVERTAAWAARAKVVHHKEGQSLFGIVQGGVDLALRAESAQRTVEIDFDGYGIGGLSVGEPREKMLPALAAAIGHLPIDHPRYLMGVGDPIGLVEGVALGVDMFDCVLPTRLARHGTLLSSTGKVKLRRAEYGTSDEPPDLNCACPVCQRWSKGYLRHLLMVGEVTGGRLCTIHNVWWTLQLMKDMRVAIAQGRFEVFRNKVFDVWGS
ncbi:MAG: tRNA guanosine(34) transglycosylase Tgt [Acidimicrobiales bacterium]